MQFIKESSTIIEKAKKEAEKEGFLYKNPSSLISEFWGTSFTPSSFEVVIKEVKSNEDTRKKEVSIFSIQACVRGQDISPWSDGIHLPYFHMFTLFVINPQDPLPYTKWFQNFLRKLKAPVDDSYFTYYAHEYPDLVDHPLFPDFGLRVLNHIGVSPNRCIPCSGYDNYQITFNYDYEMGKFIRTEGPRIEIMVNFVRPIEYGTIIYSVSSWLDDSLNVIERTPAILSMVFGIERLTQVINKVASVWQLPSMNYIEKTIMTRLKIPDLFTLETEHVLELLIGLIQIAENVPIDFRPGGKGPRDQLKRIIRLTLRKVQHLGISQDVVLEILGQLYPEKQEAINRVHDWLLEQSKLMRASLARWVSHE